MLRRFLARLLNPRRPSSPARTLRPSAKPSHRLDSLSVGGGWSIPALHQPVSERSWQLATVVMLVGVMLASLWPLFAA